MFKSSVMSACLACALVGTSSLAAVIDARLLTHHNCGDHLVRGIDAAAFEVPPRLTADERLRVATVADDAAKIRAFLGTLRSGETRSSTFEVLWARLPEFAHRAGRRRDPSTDEEFVSEWQRVRLAVDQAARAVPGKPLAWPVPSARPPNGEVPRVWITRRAETRARIALCPTWFREQVEAMPYDARAILRFLKAHFVGDDERLFDLDAREAWARLWHYAFDLERTFDYVNAQDFNYLGSGRPAPVHRILEEWRVFMMIYAANQP